MPRPLSTQQDPAKLKGITRVTWVGLWVNLILSIFKVLAGVLGHSRAVLADGLHSFTDLLTDAVILVGVRFWPVPPDADHPYGHRRLESLIALGVGAGLGLTGIGIGWEAANSLFGPKQPAGSLLALSAAIVSAISKEWLFRWTLKRGRELGSEAVMANAWEHRSDVFSSLPVIPAVAVSWWFPSLWFLDMAAALLVSLFIIRAAWKICAPAANTLLDKGATPAVCQAIMDVVTEQPEVFEVHNLRTRFLGGQLIVDMHVGVDPTLTVAEVDVIAHRIEFLLYEPETARRVGLEICDALIHIDPRRDRLPDSPQA